jgi:hypothetical protein
VAERFRRNSAKVAMAVRVCPVPPELNTKVHVYGDHGVSGSAYEIVTLVGSVQI